MSFCEKLPPEAALYYEILIGGGPDNFYFKNPVGYVRYRFAADVENLYEDIGHDEYKYLVITPRLKSSLYPRDSYWLLNFNSINFSLNEVSMRYLRFMAPDEILEIRSEYGSTEAFWTIVKETK